MSTPTQITITPDRPAQELAAYPSSAKRLAGQRLAFGTPAPEGNLFGADGFTFKDALDTINPLQHIPIVSNIYESLTGDVASPGAKLLGGALLGGPIGFVASLINVVFEQETGHSVGGATVAALTGGQETTQVARVEPIEPAPETVQKVAEAEILPPLPAAPQKLAAVEAPMKVASAITPTAATGSDQDLLSLFGSPNASAHASYRKAQFKPYLTDVTTSMVL